MMPNMIYRPKIHIMTESLDNDIRSNCFHYMLSDYILLKLNAEWLKLEEKTKKTKRCAAHLTRLQAVWGRGLVEVYCVSVRNKRTNKCYFYSSNL